MFDRCAVGHLPFSKKMYLPLVGNGAPTMRSMYPPLLGNGAHSSEHGEQSSFAGVWSPAMRSMFPPLIGLKSFLRC